MFRCVEAVYRANRAFGNVSHGFLRTLFSDHSREADDAETSRYWTQSKQSKSIRRPVDAMGQFLLFTTELPLRTYD